MRKFIKILVTVFLLYICLMFVQSQNFNGFALARFYEGRTLVSRDYKEQYHKEWSYKIESQDYNDYMIYQTIPVEKNTAYKVSCMVKTKDIVPEGKNNSGFNICLKDNLEKSTSLIGTNDWTELNFYFNSLNNETIDIAFRLGDNDGNCKGTAWFSNISIEKGKQKQTIEWKFAVFLFNHTNAKVGSQVISKNLTTSQKSAIQSDLKRLQGTALDFFNGKLRITYDVISINEPLANISYDKATGYFISAQDVYPYINSYLYNNENCYDHIFVVANIGDIINEKKIEWVGLGSMVYDSIGFSNIRISDSTLKTYQYSSFNYFPEEVLLHEFLHTLERNSNRLGNKTIALHDNEKYGYQSESGYGLRQWYLDYIQKKINGKLGLEEEVFYTQPVSQKNFSKRNIVTDDLYNQQNIVQKIIEKISKII